MSLQNTLRFQLIHPNAVPPTKAYPSDVGYDIKLVTYKEKQGYVEYYGTGLRVIPPSGYYVEVVARSSLHKRGRLLVNGIGIIDPNYRGEIIVPLLCFADVSHLPLPLSAVQLVLRPVFNPTTLELPVSEELPTTDRGEGGFGSTTKN